MKKFNFKPLLPIVKDFTSKRYLPELLLIMEHSQTKPSTKFQPIEIPAFAENYKHTYIQYFMDSTVLDEDFLLKIPPNQCVYFNIDNCKDQMIHFVKHIVTNNQLVHLPYHLISHLDLQNIQIPTILQEQISNYQML